MIWKPRIDFLQRSWIWLLFLTLLAGAGAYFTMFTGFRTYDDEGTLMLSVKQYLGGMQLYDQIFSVYGPVYYFYNAAIRTLTLTPVTHDVTRMTSLVLWLTCTLVSAWITLRLTKSLLLAGVTHFLVSLLIFFQHEPGHPQELVLFLLLVLASVPLSLGAGGHWPKTLASLGLLSSALLFVKVNIAAYVVAGLGLLLLAYGHRSRRSRLLVWAYGTGCVLFPVILMRAQLHSSWAKVYCTIEMASIAAAVICLLCIRHDVELTWRHWAAVIGGFVASCGAVLLILAAQRISLSGTFDSLVLTPARIFVENPTFYTPPPPFRPALLWAIFGLACCLWAVISRPVPASPSWHRVMLAKLVFSVVLVALSLLRPFRLLALATPFTWLIVFGPNTEDGKSQDFARKWLCILTVLQTLYAYPVAGSQYYLIQIPLLITVAISVGDSWTWLVNLKAGGRQPVGRADLFQSAQVSNNVSQTLPNSSGQAPIFQLSFGSRPKWLPLSGERLTVAGLCLVAVLYGGTCVRAMRRYLSLPSLDLPGAHRIHLAAHDRDAYRWLVRNLKEHCDVFEGLPGLPSLNFWSGLYPLTGWNSDAWTFCLTPRQQRTVAAALEPHRRACIVENPELAKFWRLTDQKAASLPLVQYIRNRFHTVGSIGGYNLMIRNDREVLRIAQY